MFKPLKISDAASIGMHAVAFLAGSSDKPFSNKEIAGKLDVSEAHLSKVLQRLSKAGLITSYRGPKGGFMLRSNGSDITLLDVIEAIEGPLELSNCLFDKPICVFEDCIIGNMLVSVNEQIRQHLIDTKLLQFSPVNSKRKQ